MDNFELITWLYRAIYLYIVVMMIGNMFREGTSLAKQIGYALVTVPQAHVQEAM